MVFYFKARPDVGDYTIFMGLDKFENEELIKYGFPEDICILASFCLWLFSHFWFYCLFDLLTFALKVKTLIGWAGYRFHVDKMSSAHVYVRLHKGNKVNNIDVVYTPWSNLKKTASMDVGQVGFHNSKMVRTVKVEKRINEIVNRLNKTKVERTPDLRAEREAVNAAERAERKLHLRDKKRREEMDRLEKERQAEMRSYKGLMVAEKMTSNKQIASESKSLQELEDDFM
ncbi:Coiled-coil domain-containing protein 25 [Linum grandiflorum]